MPLSSVVPQTSTCETRESQQMCGVTDPVGSLTAAPSLASPHLTSPLSCSAASYSSLWCLTVIPGTGRLCSRLQIFTSHCFLRGVWRS